MTVFASEIVWDNNSKNQLRDVSEVAVFFLALIWAVAIRFGGDCVTN